MSGDAHQILDEAALRAILGVPTPITQAKVLDRLNDAMQIFIAQSPLLFLSTVDGRGGTDLTPKGDPPGFVECDAQGDLLVPERPGNRLAFSFTNILRGGLAGSEVGLLFVVPHQRETLRIKGFATLHSDPEVLARMAVRGQPALLYMRVAIRECFFHCGKAMIRSHLWQPDRWATAQGSIAARQFQSPLPMDAAAQAEAEALMERAYREQLY